MTTKVNAVASDFVIRHSSFSQWPRNAGRMKKAETHQPDAIRHLYVHFPFCARICPYCAFYKTRGSGQDIERFCRALSLEADRVAKDFPLALETIFFGGGTPTALSFVQLEALTQNFLRAFDLS